MDDEKAQAPTEEMRERARVTLNDVKTASVAQETDASWIVGFDRAQDVIVQALAAQDRLARAEERERCAKWHDEQAAKCQKYIDKWHAERPGENGPLITIAWQGTHERSAAAIRAQGEK